MNNRNDDTVHNINISNNIIKINININSNNHTRFTAGNIGNAPPPLLTMAAILMTPQPTTVTALPQR